MSSMKKIVCCLITVITLIPTIANANIRCNDGTISPTCGDCHRGCCSHHGGCASSTTIQKYEEIIPTNTPKSTPVPTPESTTIIYKSEEEKEKDNSSSTAAAITALGGIGAGAYALNKKRKK